MARYQSLWQQRDALEAHLVQLGLPRGPRELLLLVYARGTRDGARSVWQVSLPALARELGFALRTVTGWRDDLRAWGLLVTKAPAAGRTLIVEVDWQRVYAADRLAEAAPDLIAWARAVPAREQSHNQEREALTYAAPDAANHAALDAAIDPADHAAADAALHVSVCNYETKNTSAGELRAESQELRAADQRSTLNSQLSTHPPLCNADVVLDFRWGRSVARHELQEPLLLLPWAFEQARLAGLVKPAEQDRIAFGALFARCLRANVANRWGLFTGLLTGRTRDKFKPDAPWRALPAAGDEEQSRRWWSQIEGDEPSAGERQVEQQQLTRLEQQQARSPEHQAELRERSRQMRADLEQLCRKHARELAATT